AALAADDSPATGVVAHHRAHLVNRLDPHALAAVLHERLPPDAIADGAILGRAPDAVADRAIDGINPHAIDALAGRRGNALAFANADIDFEIGPGEPAAIAP